MCSYSHGCCNNVVKLILSVIKSGIKLVNNDDKLLIMKGMKEINFDLYPSKDYQMKWLKLYAESYHDLNDLGPVSNDYVESLYVQVNKFALVGIEKRMVSVRGQLLLIHFK